MRVLLIPSLVVNWFRWLVHEHTSEVGGTLAVSDQGVADQIGFTLFGTESTAINPLSSLAFHSHPAALGRSLRRRHSAPSNGDCESLVYRAWRQRVDPAAVELVLAPEGLYVLQLRPTWLRKQKTKFRSFRSFVTDDKERWRYAVADLCLDWNQQQACRRDYQLVLDSAKASEDTDALTWAESRLAALRGAPSWEAYRQGMHRLGFLVTLFPWDQVGPTGDMRLTCQPTVISHDLFTFDGAVQEMKQTMRRDSHRRLKQRANAQS